MSVDVESAKRTYAKHRPVSRDGHLMCPLCGVAWTCRVALDALMALLAANAMTAADL